MTVIAGILSRDRALLMPHSVRTSIVSNVSRHPHDEPEILEGPGWLLVKVDTGAFGARASVSVPGGPALVIAGEPLIRRDGAVQGSSREGEAREIFDGLSTGSESALRQSTGTFCGAFYSPEPHSLTLFADPLSLRPIYYRVTPQLVVFASALRVLEASGVCRGEVDLRGAYEMATFGFPLADRTGYAGVRAIRPAEVIRITREAEAHSRYLVWERLAETALAGDVLVEALVTAFRDAVRRRLRGDRVALSFLSGGLDSRAIVAELRNQRAAVFTVNFGPPDTQDRVFGALAARALGTSHHQVDVPLSASASVYRKEHLRRWLESEHGPATKPDRPSCVWSGDGGSVGLGHVYMNDGAVAALERGDVDAGVRAFIDHNRIAGASNSAMTSVFRHATAAWHREGVRDEINAIERRLDGRSLHLFLMLNDQRRHLAEHFENIDLDRFEFQLPFFDRSLLETVLASPVKPFLRHALYNEWIKALSPIAAAVPWQAYPNHEPCPVPFEGRLRYQWRDYWSAKEDRRIARNRATSAARYLVSPEFPHRCLSRGRFAAAVLLSMLGRTSVGHVVKVGATFAQLFDTAGGRGASGTPAPLRPLPPAVVAPRSDRAQVSVRARVLSGFRWTASVRLVSQLITWAITLIVIRLLSPADYGLLAMATVFVAFLAMFADLGLGQALVQTAQLSEPTLRRVFTVVLGVHVALAALLALAAPLVAIVFGEPAVTPIVRVLSLQFVIAAFGVIPDAMLQRRMEFKVRSLIDLAAAVTAASCTLALALMGNGVWALAIGSLVAQLLRAAGLNWAAPWFSRLEFSLKGLRPHFRFGGDLAVAQVLAFATNHADVFIAGRWLGKEALGAYSTAVHIASLPVQRISGLINQLAFPAFSRMQGDRQWVGDKTLLGTRLLALIGFPVFWGISSIAPELVAVVLGAKWASAALPLQIISVVMPLRLIASFTLNAIQGLGRSDVTLAVTVRSSLLILAALLIGVQWGLPGLSLAWLVGSPIAFGISMSRFLPVLGLSWTELGVALAPSAGAGCLMYLAVTMAREALTLTALPLLLSLMVVGIASYGVCAWFLNRRGCLEAIGLMRSLLNPRTPERST